MLDNYLTVKGFGEREIVIEKSRFIAYANRAESEAEAVQFIDKIKKMHWQATHNCSAYLIGENHEHQKANDDGEPSGTAGKPMLEVLKKIGLHDTVVVVTRYFGGIKLGAGGLIRAYGQATKEGVKAAGVIRRLLHRELHVTVDYTWLGKVQNEVQNRGLTISNTQYLETVTLTLLIPTGEEDKEAQWLTNLTNGQAQLEWGDLVYVDQPVEIP
ncbi:putative YigZ family protein [Caldalkalibacillus uzonensis]|uniref:YigZ family protein n=1 Tax=Caldalkalibacillus uzonensis TaxID=353224 RepID=A0ABU0CWJ0_9BACI|nr:YigZ family protein [Caldalkalibacillus uzonensis]MDQ0339885.1 putative YigZ family protein [Caldalkalibacillus uzonensis]